MMGLLPLMMSRIYAWIDVNHRVLFFIVRFRGWAGYRARTRHPVFIIRISSTTGSDEFGVCLWFIIRLFRIWFDVVDVVEL